MQLTISLPFELIGAVTGVDVAWSVQATMTVRGIAPAAAAFAALLALSVIYRHRSRRLAETAKTAALWVAFGGCVVVLSYLCATTAQPLHDATFSRFDRSLGFDWWA